MSYRRGIVREVDGETGRARVEFEDRDGINSFWLEVNQPHASAAGSRSYSMPEEGSQVNCLVDEHGEAGTILGAIYSDVDKPPVTDKNRIHQDFGGGFTVDINKKDKTMSFTVPQGCTVTVGSSMFDVKPDGVTLNGSQFTVNAPTNFTQGITASGGGKTTMSIDGAMSVTKDINSGQKVTAAQEVSAPVLRGTLAK